MAGVGLFFCSADWIIGSKILPLQFFCSTVGMLPYLSRNILSHYRFADLEFSLDENNFYHQR